MTNPDRPTARPPVRRSVGGRPLDPAQINQAPKNSPSAGSNKPVRRDPVFEPIDPGAAPRRAGGRPTMPAAGSAATRPAGPRRAGPAQGLDAMSVRSPRSVSPARASRGLPPEPPGPYDPNVPPGPLPSKPPRGRRRRGKRLFVTIIVLLVLVLAWPTSLALWANSKLNHVPALSGAPDTPGTTYLIAGSDARGTGGIVDETTGARADTIMVLNVPPSGRPALMSIPRDTYVQVPGYGGQKINAAYAYGGPSLLVQTVEQLTSLTIDHYVEVGFGSLTDLVDAVGGVNLCWDQTVNDQMSGMVWEAGCHDADGATALAFSRMRYSDPLGDIGRGQRQRLVIAALAKKAMSPATFLWPPQQIKLVNAGTAAITVDSKTSILDIGKMMLAFRKATGPGGATGVPTIANTGYNVAGVGSTVLLDEAQAAADFAAVKAGTWEGTSPPQQ